MKLYYLEKIPQIGTVTRSYWKNEVCWLADGTFLFVT